MAKFTRNDVRNKNAGKHKAQTMIKEIKIRPVESNEDETQTKKMLREVMNEKNPGPEYLND
jgi:hypothetical protein